MGASTASVSRFLDHSSVTPSLGRPPQSKPGPVCTPATTRARERKGDDGRLSKPVAAPVSVVLPIGTSPLRPSGPPQQARADCPRLPWGSGGGKLCKRPALSSAPGRRSARQEPVLGLVTSSIGTTTPRCAGRPGREGPRHRTDGPTRDGRKVRDLRRGHWPSRARSPRGTSAARLASRSVPGAGRRPPGPLQDHGGYRVCICWLLALHTQHACDGSASRTSFWQERRAGSGKLAPIAGHPSCDRAPRHHHPPGLRQGRPHRRGDSVAAASSARDLPAEQRAWRKDHVAGRAAAGGSRV